MADNTTNRTTINQDSVRVPPHDMNAEGAVLSAMLLEEWATARGLELLREDYFYKSAHRYIFRAIQELFNKNIEIDLITIIDELKKKDVFEKIGGTAYLTDIQDIVSSSANLETHAQLVIEKATLRSLIHTASSIIEECYGTGQDSKEIVEHAEKKIFNVTQSMIKEGFERAFDIVSPTIKKIDEIAKRKTKIVGVATGFNELDRITGGFQPGQFIVVAARPSMGKTALALNIAHHAAVFQDKRVGIFSLEMDKETLIMRMLSSGSDVSLHSMLHGYGMDKDKIMNLTRHADKIAEAPIFIDDRGSNTMNDIRSKARRLKFEEGLDLLIIDYMQLLLPVASRQSRQQEISEISRSIKILAKELEVPIIAVSQLSRGPETRQDKIPQLADLRESGAIEQDADLVLLIFREEYYKKEEAENPGIAIIDVAKNRNGPQGRMNLKFVGPYTRFENIDNQSFA
ncbi:MAG: replicative DNA helicase [Candidatus Cloacimonetes bacterium]|nr:replicative DNA helicase [Candidatus Cloacimonadota bacterium]